MSVLFCAAILMFKNRTWFCHKQEFFYFEEQKMFLASAASVFSNDCFFTTWWDVRFATILKCALLFSYHRVHDLRLHTSLYVWFVSLTLYISSLFALPNFAIISGRILFRRPLQLIFIWIRLKKNFHCLFLQLASAALWLPTFCQFSPTTLPYQETTPISKQIIHPAILPSGQHVIVPQTASSPLLVQATQQVMIKQNKQVVPKNGAKIVLKKIFFMCNSEILGRLVTKCKSQCILRCSRHWDFWHATNWKFCLMAARKWKCLR